MTQLMARAELLTTALGVDALMSLIPASGSQRIVYEVDNRDLDLDVRLHFELLRFGLRPASRSPKP